jgi:hypothetical protein
MRKAGAASADAVSKNSIARHAGAGDAFVGIAAREYCRSWACSSFLLMKALQIISLSPMRALVY